MLLSLCRGRSCTPSGTRAHRRKEGCSDPSSGRGRGDCRRNSRFRAASTNTTTITITTLVAHAHGPSPLAGRRCA